MDDRQRQRMWWEAATTATTGLLAFLTRETYPDIPIPDRVSLLVVRVAGQYADDLLAEYDRRFPTPHPAPADATGEGEDGVRYYSRLIPGGENQVGFKVERGQVWFRGSNGVWTESLTWTLDELERDVVRGKRRRLTPTEAAALLAHRKPEAKEADTTTP